MRWAVALLPLALAWPALRDLIESSMALHMLLEFPLLLAAGAAAAGLARADPLRRLDAHGLLGITAASCVAAFWMLPAALDLSLLSPLANGVKYASWWAAGALLLSSGPRLRIEVAAFFLGNIGWMLATVGLLYRDAEARLCVNYLLDEQAVTGAGLIAWALGLLTLALTRVVSMSRTTR